METKWTKGPWLISTPTQGYEVCTMHGLPPQPSEDGRGRTWVYIRPESLTRNGEWHWPDEQEQLANAHLIAAAPTMADYVKRKADDGCEEAASIWEQINAR